MNLTLVTKEQLEAELEKRKKQALPKPMIVDDPNFDSLIETCQWYIDAIDNDGFEPKDGEAYIAELALKLIFGANVYDWINKKLT